MYQWWNSSGAINGATSPSYTLRSSDVGRYVWVEVKATVGGPWGGCYSEFIGPIQ
jgi:hypothetical protein